jgi:hypothetical protein
MLNVALVLREKYVVAYEASTGSPMKNPGQHGV